VYSHLEGSVWTTSLTISSCFSSSSCIIWIDVSHLLLDNMMGMRSVFLSCSEIESDCYVGCGANTRLAMKGVGSVRFQ
jgi:hypothetical protein